MHVYIPLQCSERCPSGEMALCQCGLMFVGCFTSLSQGRVCSDTEIEVADQTFYLSQSQFTDIGPTSPRVDLLTPGAWKGSACSASFKVTSMTTWKKVCRESGIRTLVCRARYGRLTTRPTRRSSVGCELFVLFPRELACCVNSPCSESEMRFRQSFTHSFCLCLCLSVFLSL